MASLLAGLRRLLSGERRLEPRIDAEHRQILARQLRLARRLARLTGAKPEDLLDYHRADALLGARRR